MITVIFGVEGPVQRSHPAGGDWRVFEEGSDAMSVNGVRAASYCWEYTPADRDLQAGLLSEPNDTMHDTALDV